EGDCVVRIPQVEPQLQAELLEVLALLKRGWTRAESVARPPLVLRLLGARTRYCLAGAIAQVRWGEPWRYSQLEWDPLVQALGFPSPGELTYWNDCQKGAAPVLERVERAAYF